MTISAKIIADSISPQGIRLTTMELNYHRFIHSEVMTHRMFSRNASSSRAIPVTKMLEQVRNSPALPIHWGRNQPGMQAREEVAEIGKARHAWELAADTAAHYVVELSEYMNVHKQIVNRLLEPFQYIKVIVTATEWDNFFNLRLHPDAQPEIAQLALVMKEAMDVSSPNELAPGEWHLPYVSIKDVLESTTNFKDDDEVLNTALKCSVARCARVSYLNHDNTSPDIDKDLELADKLLSSRHMSPFEHQATPMLHSKDDGEMFWENGQTHMDKHLNMWSNNFRGWIQNRALMEAQ